MAFDIAGLGGSFASGALAGAESVQQQRETISAKREQDYLQMYSKLIQSGEWTPVDERKGVRDGGVLVIPGVGNLQQMKTEGLSAQDFQRRKAGELSAARTKALEEKLDLVEIDTMGEIPGPKGTPIRVKGTRQGYVDNRGEFVKFLENSSFVPGKPGPLPKDPSVWVDETTGKTTQVFPGTAPPPGTVKHGGYLSEARMSAAQAKTSAGEYGRKADIAAAKEAKSSRVLLIPLKSIDTPAGKLQASVIQAALDSARFGAMEQATKEGKLPWEVEKAGQDAADARQVELDASMVEKEEEPGFLSKAYDKTYDFLGELFGSREEAERVLNDRLAERLRAPQY